jgi:uncharacterized membrane protein
MENQSTAQPKVPVKLVFDHKDIEDNKVISAIGYLGILFLVPLLMKKDSKFATFHAKQALILFVVEVLLSFVNIVPFLGQIIWALGMIVCVLVSLLALIQTLNGKAWEIPYISEYAKKINI